MWYKGGRGARVGVVQGWAWYKGGRGTKVGVVQGWVWYKGVSFKCMSQVCPLLITQHVVASKGYLIKYKNACVCVFVASGTKQFLPRFWQTELVRT